jgi:hypothetical protein
MLSFRSIAGSLALVATLVATAPSAFAQFPACPDPPLSPPVSARIQPAVPCTGDVVFAVFEACGPCWDIRSAEFGPGGIVVRAVQPDPQLCFVRDNTRPCDEESLALQLGQLAAGHHAFLVTYESTVILRDSLGTDSLACTFVHRDTIEFDVAPTCPPPPPGPLPYLNAVRIGLGAPCDSCPAVACVGDSIPVRLSGEFPTGCFDLANVELIEQPIAGPFPVPPLVRLWYRTLSCVEFPCVATVIVPWEAHVNLPPLPALFGHTYMLPVQAVIETTHCEGPPDTTFLGQTAFPFTVVDSCDTLPPRPCFLSGFVVEPALARCDAFVGPGQPATVDYRIGSTVDLHGLQGSFKFDPWIEDTRQINIAPLRVTGIEAIGAAAGMRLQWQPTDDGARFVLFSEGNAFIPAAPPMPDSARLPILRVRVEVVPDAGAPPPRVTMRAHDLLAADRNGQQVLHCPILFILEPRDQHAVFCTGNTCDFNQDGAKDVRDLVQMVRCLTDSTLRCDLRNTDCENDQDFDLDDVICCARQILNGGQPDTTGGRPDPALSVSFGVPVVRDGAVEVPVTLAGGPSVAGARIALRYPDDRFQVDDVVFPGRSSWLELFEARNGRVVVGLLAMSPVTLGPFHHEFTVRLALRPGATVGGDVALDDAQFSDGAGVALIGDLGAPSVNLGGDMALSSGQPNPFGRELGFSVTMVRAGDLDVVVHDVSGREVATIHRGPATAGAHTFRWNGRRDDGGTLPDGMYFVRARALGTVVARKAILLREP